MTNTRQQQNHKNRSKYILICLAVSITNAPQHRPLCQHTFPNSCFSGDCCFCSREGRDDRVDFGWCCVYLDLEPLTLHPSTWLFETRKMIITIFHILFMGKFFSVTKVGALFLIIHRSSVAKLKNHLFSNLCRSNIITANCLSIPDWIIYPGRETKEDGEWFYYGLVLSLPVNLWPPFISSYFMTNLELLMPHIYPCTHAHLETIKSRGGIMGNWWQAKRKRQTKEEVEDDDSIMLRICIQMWFFYLLRFYRVPNHRVVGGGGWVSQARLQ